MKSGEGAAYIRPGGLNDEHPGVPWMTSETIMGDDIPHTSYGAILVTSKQHSRRVRAIWMAIATSRRIHRTSTRPRRKAISR